MNNIANQPLPRMRGIRQAAIETGLAVNFVRQLVKKNKIVSISAGRKILVNLDSLIAYLNTGEGVNNDDQA